MPSLSIVCNKSRPILYKSVSLCWLYLSWRQTCAGSAIYWRGYWPVFLDPVSRKKSRRRGANVLGKCCKV